MEAGMSCVEPKGRMILVWVSWITAHFICSFFLCFYGWVGEWEAVGFSHKIVAPLLTVVLLEHFQQLTKKTSM